MKLCQNDYLDEMSDVVETGSCWIKNRSPGQIIEKLVNTTKVTFYAKSSWSFVSMIALIIAQTSLKLDHVGSKTRSLGQIIRKACKHSRGNILCQIFMKLCQNYCLEDRSDKFESGNLHKTLSDYIYLDLRKTSGDKTWQHLGQFYLVSELRPTMGLLLY